MVLRARAEAWDALDIRRVDTQAWPDNSPFCVHVDLSDADHNLIYGTLRIDYDGARLVGGWSDGQLVCPIELARPDSFETSAFASPEEAAEIAVRWLEAQLCRPIQRREKRLGSLLTHVCWALADTGDELCDADRWLFPIGILKFVVLRPARTSPNG